MKLIVYLLIFFALLFVGCKNNSSSEGLIPVKVLLNSITAQSTRVDHLEEVENFNAFKYLKKHSADYQTAIKRVIIAPDSLYSQETKLMCIQAAQSLQWNEYMNLVNSCLDSLSTDRNSWLVIKELIFNKNNLVDGLFIDNYNREDVQKLCERIITDDKLDPWLKTQAKEIKEGIAYKRRFQIQKMRFNAILDSIGEIDFAIELEGSPYFQYVYRNPEKYSIIILETLSSSEISFHKKCTCIYMLQKLPLNSYIHFCSKGLKQFEKGNIEKRIMELLLFPEEWRTNNRLIINYNNPNVNQLLAAAIANKRFDRDFKESLLEVRNGVTYKEHQKMRANGYREN